MNAASPSQALRQVGGLKTFGFPESFGRTEVFGA